MRVWMVWLFLMGWSVGAMATPCSRPGAWPFKIHSSKYPFWVHYRKAGQRRVAQAIVGYMDRAWALEVGKWGFSPPPLDGGSCGPDQDFDVFVWRGHVQCYVSSLEDDPTTPWADARAYMVVDPWGPYGGEWMRSTIFHEFNHALQAADDWTDNAAVYEMTAQFAEWLSVGNNEVYEEVLADFQAHPDWSLDYNDGYHSWYMYGSALYLHFLRDHYFGSVGFLSEMWHGMRNPPGATDPDFEDSLDEILPEPFLDTVPLFARWRWYTGEHADGAHFLGSVQIPGVSVAGTLTLAQQTESIDLEPMALGSSYIDLLQGSGGPAHVRVRWEAPASEVSWVVEAVPGLDGSDGERLTQGATIDWASGRRTLIVTAISPVDPDERDAQPDRRFPIQIYVDPVP